jgi:ubiquinone/menaquinone biosynthesis C-methylase UbiE
MTENRITASEIKSLSYVEFMAWIDETNRPPGGKLAVRELIDKCNVTADDRVLDVGCNTGFVSFEISRVTGADVVGIDMSEDMIAQARNRNQAGYSPKSVDFQKGDAQQLPFPDQLFDCVVSGGSTAFVHDIEAALSEYRRVVKDWGFVGEINFYYDEKPSADLIEELNDRMGTTIEEWYFDDWIRLYENADLEIYDVETHSIDHRSEEEIREYVQIISENNNVNDSAKEAIESRLLDLMQLFNRNHEYLNYAVFTLRRRAVEEQMSLFS